LSDKISKNESKEEVETSQTKELSDLENLPIPTEMLDKLSPDVKQTLIMLSQQRIGFPVNPINNKITPEHISKIIESSEKDSEREFELGKLEIQDQNISRLYFVVTLVVVLLFVGSIIYFLSNDKETMRFVLGLIVGLLGGFGIKEILPTKKKKD
jgi:hypothetical protein